MYAFVTVVKTVHCLENLLWNYELRSQNHKVEKHPPIFTNLGERNVNTVCLLPVCVLVHYNMDVAACYVCQLQILHSLFKF